MALGDARSSSFVIFIVSETGPYKALADLKPPTNYLADDLDLLTF